MRARDIILTHTAHSQKNANGSRGAGTRNRKGKNQEPAAPLRVYEWIISSDLLEDYEEWLEVLKGKSKSSSSSDFA
jgi:hypothetical protein